MLSLFCTLLSWCFILASALPTNLSSYHGEADGEAYWETDRNECKIPGLNTQTKTQKSEHRYYIICRGYGTSNNLLIPYLGCNAAISVLHPTYWCPCLSDSSLTCIHECLSLRVWYNRTGILWATSVVRGNSVHYSPALTSSLTLDIHRKIRLHLITGWDTSSTVLALPASSNRSRHVTGWGRHTPR